MLSYEIEELLHMSVYEANKRWYEDQNREIPKYEEFDGSFDWRQLMFNESLGPVDDMTLEIIDQYGGEGHGDLAYIVIKITHSDGEIEYWRKDGSYASFYGFDWDGELKQVNPVQRMVTFYE